MSSIKYYDTQLPNDNTQKTPTFRPDGPPVRAGYCNCEKCIPSNYDQDPDGDFW
ncbi:hypothetical protein FWC63_03255 [Candidatus Saccharibacteria bacterium]|nr:hypothetical protein [Candidatus Saccharibacteria bacterium]